MEIWSINCDDSRYSKTKYHRPLLNNGNKLCKLFQEGLNHREIQPQILIYEIEINKFIILTIEKIKNAGNDDSNFVK